MTRQWACEGACISGPWSGAYVKSDTAEVALLDGYYEHSVDRNAWIWMPEK